jgi:N6-L-threonylcarbamoyladenine synthase
VLSNVINSQIETHTVYGGVVPEIASRKHIEAIVQVVRQALSEADRRIEDIDAVAVTYGPGLVGPLLVGVSYAKAFAYGCAKPLIAVHHIEGHIAANYIEYKELEPPFMCLVVSGGHTHLVNVRDYGDYEILGRTMDDAAGEAYDKVARAIGLGYPGGPKIDRAAREGNPEAIAFPRAHVDGEEYDFSFSGLKTAVLQMIQREEKKGEQINIADAAYCFQETALQSMVKKTLAAVKEYRPKMLVLAGGVAANSRLRVLMEEEMKKIPETKLVIPPLYCCTDNAAMIGAAGYVAYMHGERAGLDLSADPGMLMPGEEY